MHSNSTTVSDTNSYEFLQILKDSFMFEIIMIIMAILVFFRDR